MFLDADATPIPASPDESQERPRRFSRTAARLLAPSYLRACLIVGLSAIGLLTLKNPFTVLLGPWLSPNVATWLANLHVGRQIEVSAGSPWFSVRIGLEVSTGFLLLASAGLLAAKRDRLGTAAGYFALLLSLTTVTILLFYFEQFSTIITTTIQFLLLIGIIIFRRHKP